MNWLALLLLGFAVAGAHAQTLSASRTSGFGYAASGQLNVEVVEPNTADLCARTEYTLDAYGNRTAATVSSCAGASVDAQVAARTTSTVYATQSVTVAGVGTMTVAQGAFATQITNAKGHIETRQYDPRFGQPVSVTGPNSLTTTIAYDDFGRKVLEVAPDGTKVVTRHCLLAVATDTSSNSAGCSTAPANAPALAVSYVEAQQQNAAGTAIGPYARKYSDALGRVIREETQGYDGAQQPANARTIVKDVEYNAWGAAIKATQPYFLGTGSSTSAGSNDAGWGVTEYDALGRPVTVYSKDAEGGESYGGATVAKATKSYNGLVITESVDRTYKNGAGQQVTTVALTTTRTSNPLGQLVQVTDSTGATLSQKFDAFGNVIESRDAQDNRILTTFDARGRRTQMNDPNAGTWNYRYNAVGELTKQQSPLQIAGTATITAGSWTTFTYDALGRQVTRTEPEYTTTWSYDKYADNSACTKGVGKLCQVVTSHGVSKKATFDSYGRPLTTIQAITGGPSFTTSLAYDANGRVSSYTYPTGLAISYTYTALGFQQQVSQGATMLWRLDKVNAWGKPETQVSGDASQTTVQAFDASTGRLASIKVGSTGTPGAILDRSYGWDTVGNLTDRLELYNPSGSQSLSENFSYDSINRLASYQTASPGIAGLNRTVTLAYSPIGNILYKSDVGAYSYPASGTVALRPGAVTSITATQGSNLAYSYDAAGNLTSATGAKYSQLTYTSFNLPDAQGGALGANGNRYTWQYGPDHERVKEVKVAGGVTRTTWYAHPDNANGLAFEHEQVGAGTATNRHYVSAMGGTFLVITTVATAPTTPTDWQWWHKDHLGSIATITNATYQVVQRMSYDPFGKRRDINGSYDANGVLVYDYPGATDRGFTGHEHLDDVGIVNMNGRMYDPHIGRFMQADPYIQAPDLLQNYNRYSYVLNNPLNMVDPRGQFFQTLLIAAAWTAGAAITLRALGIINTKTMRQLLGVATMMAIGSPQAAGLFAGEAALQVAIAGMAAGAVSCGGECIGSYAFSAMITFGVGELASFYKLGSGAHGLAHGVGGCVRSMAGGGKCGHGAVSAAFSFAAGEGYKTTNPVEKMLVHTLIGGTTSVLAGDKFANGALSGAFVFLFNGVAHNGRELARLAAKGAQILTDYLVDAGAEKIHDNLHIRAGGVHAIADGIFKFNDVDHFLAGEVKLGEGDYTKNQRIVYRALRAGQDVEIWGTGADKIAARMGLTANESGVYKVPAGKLQIEVFSFTRSGQFNESRSQVLDNALRKGVTGRGGLD